MAWLCTAWLSTQPHQANCWPAHQEGEHAASSWCSLGVQGLGVARLCLAGSVCCNWSEPMAQSSPLVTAWVPGRSTGTMEEHTPRHRYTAQREWCWMLFAWPWQLCG
jgi:hypothetical protein